MTRRPKQATPEQLATLRELYGTMAFRTLARELQTSEGVVQRWVDEEDLPLRQMKKGRKPALPSAEQLERLRAMADDVECNMDEAEIRLGVTRWTLRAWCERYQIHWRRVVRYGGRRFAA